MLCAIYVKPYHIICYNDLFTLTRQAGFYCALPIVSRTLDLALHSSQDFVDRIPDNRCGVFKLAAKLRNKVLFRKALVWIADLPAEVADEQPHHPSALYSHSR